MSVSTERPGVYSTYDASSVVYGTTGSLVVGAVGQAASGKRLEVTQFTNAAQADKRYGTRGEADPGLPELVRLALKNGASSVVAVPAAVGSVPPVEWYQQALDLLADREDIDLVICDSSDPEVHTLVKNHVEACANARRERLAVVAGAAGETVTDLTARASALNSERVVLVAPATVKTDGTPLKNGILGAAAVAGAIAAEEDPAIPLGGAALLGLNGLETQYADGDIDLLIRGGVTPLETLAGETRVVRGITTRTKTGNLADATWRELTTIRVVDNVIPAVRNALRARFARTKNTPQTRSAIASQVVVLLEEKVDRQIIDSYGDVTVTADRDDPSLCLVEFHFAVAHGLNQIHIAAHITV